MFTSSEKKEEKKLSECHKIFKPLERLKLNCMFLFLKIITDLENNFIMMILKTGFRSATLFKCSYC